jgi:hypothetical protein
MTNQVITRLEQIVEISTLIAATGQNAKPEWQTRCDYVGALVQAGSTPSVEGFWSDPRGVSESDYENAETACREFGVKPIIENVASYFLVDQDLAHDLATKGELVQEDYDNGLAVWCRTETGPIEESDVLGSLNVTPLNPFE